MQIFYQEFFKELTDDEMMISSGRLFQIFVILIVML